jgi:hypothetical protein
MFEGRNRYTSPMRDFLNEFASDNDIDSGQLEKLSALFKQTISICNQALGRAAFRPISWPNVAISEPTAVILYE